MVDPSVDERSERTAGPPRRDNIFSDGCRYSRWSYSLGIAREESAVGGLSWYQSIDPLDLTGTT